MDELIARLDRWLRQNRPDEYAKLLPGAKENEIVAKERQAEACRHHLFV